GREDRYGVCRVGSARGKTLLLSSIRGDLECVMVCARELLLFSWVLVGSGIASIISENSSAQTGAPEEPTFSETVKFIQAKLTDTDGTSGCDWVTRNEKGITSFSANEDGSVAIERDRNSTGAPDNWN